MTDPHAQPAPPAAPRWVCALVVDDELPLFERALYAERFAYASRGRGPRTLGAVQLHDDESARQLLARLHA